MLLILARVAAVLIGKRRRSPIESRTDMSITNDDLRDLHREA